MYGSKKNKRSGISDELYETELDYDLRVLEGVIRGIWLSIFFLMPLIVVVVWI